MLDKNIGYWLSLNQILFKSFCHVGVTPPTHHSKKSLKSLGGEGIFMGHPV